MTSNFKTRVYDIVAQIPEGQVMTYGQIAALCGRPRAARVIGTIAKGTQFCHLHAHSERTELSEVQGGNENQANRTNGTKSETRKQSTQQFANNNSGAVSFANRQVVKICSLCELPWHRVVKKDGSLAEGYPGGTEGHKKFLEEEGVKIDRNYKIIDMHAKLWQPA